MSWACAAPGERTSQRFSKRRDIDPAAADHGSPGRSVDEIEQAVIEAEADERLGRIFADPHRRSGPDRRRHRIEIAVAKGRPIAAPVEIGFERTEILAADVLPRLAEESHDVAQHRPIARPQQVGGLRDETAQAGAGIFDRAVVDRGRERHVAFARLDAKAPEQGGEVRICALIVDDEAAIDRRAVPIERIGMTAEARLGLVKGHVAGLGEKPRGAEPRNAAANDGDPQRA